MTTEYQNGLPRAETLRDAIDVFFAHAYPDGVGEQISLRFTAPDDGELARWLIDDVGEPEPASADIASVKSIALRLGNAFYPNMKLRLTRPPGSNVFLLMVDSHDVMLAAQPGSPDYQALEELKSANAALVADITTAWDRCALPTERNYLRDKIRQARGKGSDQ
jgi:hypothetical protein